MSGSTGLGPDRSGLHDADPDACAKRSRRASRTACRARAAAHVEHCPLGDHGQCQRVQLIITPRDVLILGIPPEQTWPGEYFPTSTLFSI